MIVVQNVIYKNSEAVEDYLNKLKDWYKKNDRSNKKSSRKAKK